MKKISIVVPCFNEEGNVVEMYEAIKRVMASLPQYDYENLFIDNCSVDKTPDLLREIAFKDKHVKVILNNRNFGPEQSGVYACIKATGDAVIALPCDFQDPPELIPDFIAKWEKGAKVVWGQKIESEESKKMRFIRTLYYKIIKMLTPIPQYEQVTGFGLLDKKVMQEVEERKDPWPLFRNIIPDLGYIPVLLPYKQNSRKRGKSSYNFFRYFDTALNSLVHTSKVPLKFAIYLGGFFSAMSFFLGCYFIIKKLLFWDAFDMGIAPIIVLICMIASLQIFFLGILGEYVLAILDRVSFRHYVIEKERINFDE